MSRSFRTSMVRIHTLSCYSLVDRSLRAGVKNYEHGQELQARAKNYKHGQRNGYTEIVSYSLLDRSLRAGVKKYKHGQKTTSMGQDLQAWVKERVYGDRELCKSKSMIRYVSKSSCGTVDRPRFVCNESGSISELFCWICGILKLGGSLHV